MVRVPLKRLNPARQAQVFRLHLLDSRRFSSMLLLSVSQARSNVLCDRIALDELLACIVELAPQSADLSRARTRRCCVEKRQESTRRAWVETKSTFQ